MKQLAIALLLAAAGTAGAVRAASIETPGTAAPFGARLPLPGLEAAPRGAVPFDRERVFLAPTADELGGDIDLARKLGELAARDFAGSWYDGRAAGVHGLGDVVRRFESVRDDPAGIARELERLRAAAPNVARDVEWFLPELLDARVLKGDGNWKAVRNQPDDGLYAAGGWKPDRKRWCNTWSELDREDRLKAGQAAVLIFPSRGAAPELDTAAATLARYLAAVHDFAAYRERRGLSTNYERVELTGPVAVSADGTSAVYRTRNELAHWLAGDFTLTMRERLAEDGRFVADSHTTDGPFTLMAACTQGWPLFDADGKFVCLLLVSQLVTKPGDPDSMLRGSLGNLKRIAEHAPNAE